MILRSVMKHVREQNWVAVFLDFLIVVVGVFIGLQVANWNDERKARIELSAALQNLAQEISNTAARREDQVRYQRRAMFRYELLLALLDGEKLTEDQKSDAFTAVMLPNPPPEPSRYETLYELQNSGRLKDIPSRELRGALGELLSRDRLIERYYESWAGVLTAPPFSTRLVTYGLTEPAGSEERTMKIVAVDLEQARLDPDFRAHAIQMRHLFQINADSQQSGLQMDRIVLEILEREGFSPSENWLESNLDRLQAVPDAEEE